MASGTGDSYTGPSTRPPLNEAENAEADAPLHTMTALQRGRL